MKKTSFIQLKILLFLLTAFIFIGHSIGQAEEVPVRERLVSVNLQDQDFTQALEAIAGQAGITVNLHGQMPAGKRDLSMDEVPLGQAMAQVFRMYGIRNHAAAYNPGTETVMLAILETSTHVATFQPEAIQRTVDDEIIFMTPEEFAQLPPGEPDDFQHMTPEAFAQLPPGDPDDSQHMTSEEFAQLPPGEPDDFQHMTPEEFAQLPPGDPDDFQHMTSEEFYRLKK